MTVSTAAPEIGSLAPDFELKDSSRQPVKLSDFRGKKNVVLVFYPAAFSNICSGELCTLRDQSLDFVGDDVQLLAISVDPIASLRAFKEQNGFDYPLLSDFWPHGAVSEAYGVFVPDLGFATRGTCIIDKEGILRWSVINTLGDARSTDEYRAALAAL
jgi:mycoredoxin-dependent peroxiredoxin